MKNEINYFGDFETSTAEYSTERSELICFTFRSQVEKKHFTGVKFKEFWKMIRDENVNTMYFHNLSWDGEFIIWNLIETGFGFAENKFKMEDGEFTWLKTDTGRIYNLTVKYEDHTVTFLDSYALIPISVADMGTALGLPKLDADYDAHKPVDKLEDLDPVYVEYMKRDVDIVVDYFNKFAMNWLDYKMTIGSTVKNDIVKQYGLERWAKDFGGKYFDFNTGTWAIYNVLNEEEWEELQLGYKGGLTVYNPKYVNQVIEDKIIGIDENSAYSSVMVGLLPYGKPLSKKPSGTYLTLYKVHIFHTWKKDKDMVSHLHSNDSFGKFSQHYLDEVKDEVYIYLDEEWEELKLTYELVEGVNYEVIKKTYFRTKYTHKNWVLEKYKLKENAKDKVERTGAKFGLNNAYGKEGQKLVMKKKILEYHGAKEQMELRLGNWYNDWIEVEVEEKTKTISYIPLAIVITARARVILIRAIRANKMNFLYADTDSIYLKGDKIEGDLEIHPTKLGAWDIEKIGRKFKVIKPKCYIIELQDGKIARTISGLPKKAHSVVNFDNFNEGQTFEGVKLVKKRVRGGLLLVPSPFTL